VWETYADRLGIRSDPFLPLTGVALVVAGTLAVALTASIVPALLVTRTNTAENLRAPD
jgi:hypothetical protein